MQDTHFSPGKTALGLLLLVVGAPFAPIAPGQQPARQSPSATSSPAAADVQLHQAARSGDLSGIRSLLRRGVSPDARDATGRTALMDAAAANQTSAMKLLIEKGAGVNLASPAGETPLTEAASRGNADALRLLISSGADLNRRSRAGTALEIAERLGHAASAATLRQAGARTFGRSVGDSVCVRPWNGGGFCGTVQAITKSQYRLRVTRIAGCEGGCEPRPDCSAGRAVGGAGLRPGDLIEIPSWCITQTDAKP